MKKTILALSFLIPFWCFAQEPEVPKKEKDTQVTYFVKAKEGIRPTKNTIFVFDCSTSMGEDDRFLKAISEIKRILQYPLDDGMFSMLGFQTDFSVGEEFFIWEGIPEKGPPPTPKYWAKLPSLDAIKSANKFLSNIKCEDWTNIFPAIEKAFTLNKEKENLTIILFSDGNNTYPSWNGEMPAKVKAKIEKLQAARVAAKKDRILIYVFGVGKNQNVGMLSAIAQAGGGSYLTLENYCKKCASHKLSRADFQQFHERNHGEKITKSSPPALEDDLPPDLDPNEFR